MYALSPYARVLKNNLDFKTHLTIIMNSLRCVTFVLAAITLSSATVLKPSASGDNFELLILHNNDMHARFEQTSQLSGACTTDDREAGKCYGGFPRVAHVVKEARRAAQSGEGPPVLYLNAGDTYTGTAWFTIYKWKIAAEFINALQPDAVSLGNHELDNEVSGLTPFIKNLTCPVLAANLNLTNEPDLEAEQNLMKSVIVNINGTKIGIIGYLTPDTKFLAKRNKIEYIEEITAIKEEVENLKRNGVTILIALGHSGFSKDLEIAKYVDDIDIVIGGHTHTFLWNGTSPDSENPEGSYPTLVKQASGRTVLVVQAYAYTKYIGKLNLFFDSQGEVIKFEGSPILLDKSVPQDSDVLSILDKYKSDFLRISNIIAGNTSVILDGGSCRIKECNLGNLIADAIIYKYAKEYKGTGWSDAPIAVTQGGGVRASIAHVKLPAIITRGDLLSIMPFGGHIVKLKVNGSVILSMFEHAVAKYTIIQSPGQFLQVSGLKVVYNLKNPPGERVVSIMTLCGLCTIPTYSVLNENDTYNILIPSFLAMGGDGFTFLSDIPSSSLAYNELDAVITYLQGYSPVYPAVEGRIVFSDVEQLVINSVSRTKMSILVYLLTLIFVII